MTPLTERTRPGPPQVVAVAAREDPAQIRGRFHAAFRSILYAGGSGDEAGAAPRGAPEYFADLNLDQVVASVTAGKEEYDLKPFFHGPLETVEGVLYRHEVMRDLENGAIRGCITSFAKNMRLMRQEIAQAGKLHYRHQKERWFLRAVETYCTAVRELGDVLCRVEPSSQGLLAFREYVTEYAASDRFVSLAAAASALARDLAAVRYSILIRGNGFKVRRYDGETDYSAEIAEVFEKFRQGAAKDYRVEFLEDAGMNHVEAKVLEFVALLHGDTFSALDAFCQANRDYADAALTRFDREVQFYLAYIEHMDRLRRAGLRFCYPRVSATDKEVRSDGGFDLALAGKLLASDAKVVCNDVSLTGQERILLVSGPNQGGKTTFARTFGQLHYLASIGCPVPGRRARLFLFNAMFTHFEREEDIRSLRGKLQDDLVRIHDILEAATPRSIVIMNEIFNSTALKDAIFLARKVLERLVDLDLLCVCVTFLGELEALSGKIVSMVGTVVPDNPAERTFKVVRRSADGRSYAISVAEKHRLTYECLKARIPS